MEYDNIVFAYIFGSYVRKHLLLIAISILLSILTRRWILIPISISK